MFSALGFSDKQPEGGRSRERTLFDAAEFGVVTVVTIEHANAKSQMKTI
jgi:hypothetical protein